MIQIENFTQDVSKPVVSIKALQHGMGAADFDLFQQEFFSYIFVGYQRRIRQTISQCFSELLKGHRRLFHPLLSLRQQCIAGDPVNPGAEATLAFKASQARDNTDQNFLRSILGILRMPEEPYSKVVHILLYCPHERFQGVAVAFFGDRNQGAYLMPWLIARVQECPSI
jgi:hypothetical protein